MTPTFPPAIMDLLPWDNMQDFIDDFTKGLQELIDAVSQDPDADNNRNLYIPHTYGTYTCLVRMSVNNVSTNYNDWVHSFGQQPYAGVCKVVINGTTPELVDMSVVGRLYAGDWFGIRTPEEIETLNTDIAAWFKPENFVFENLEQPKLIEMSADQVNPNNTRFLLHPAGYGGDKLKLYITDINGEHTITPVRLWFYPIELRDDGESDYGRYSVVGGSAGTIDHITSGNFTVPYGTPIVSIFTSDTDAQDFVSKNGSDNNYTLTYQGDGDEIKVYYGDNYIIYVVPDEDEISYDDIYNVTVDVVNDIDPTIHVPTYRENKYGPEPPKPTDDDDYVDMGLGVETDGMAMYNMAVITRDELIQLITDFETNADTGLSFIPHVLGLYKLGIESSQLLTTKSEQIKLHKEPNGTSAFTSVDNYNIVEEQLTVIDCGSITVDREVLLTNTFYDYSPYSTYEMFIPGCGWITLPDTIVGRTISVSIVFDLTTCSCKGVVRSEGQLIGGSGTTLATVNGIIGSSVPLSINETGLQRAAIFNGSTQAAMALGTAFLGASLGNPYMGASGLAMAAGALADNHVAGNTTYTNTKGGATDYSVFGDGYKAVLKITRPVVEIPDNYGHTVGFVVNEYGLLSDFHGFTVCVNPHVHISATSDEKEEIKRLLESGVILPDGE